MGLILAGIDEAGYGPLLGPLCVGMAAVRIEGWKVGEPAPDIWSLLTSAVCKKANDPQRRIAVDDSKKLKLANDAARHPLTHLERGVLTFLAHTDARPETDAALFDALGVTLEAHPWYAAAPSVCPVAGSWMEFGIAANRLAGALNEGGVEVLHLACEVIGETRFNATVKDTGTKAAATALGVKRHLGHVWEHLARVPEGEGDPRDAVRVVCDRQGGRIDYGRYLAELVPGATVIVREQAAERCRYELHGPGADGRRREMSVIVMPEAESAHLTVALASMTAKLIRETLMARFNRYWKARASKAGLAELKPTAGYREDGRRWLRDAAKVVTAAERNAMIRTA